MKKSQNRFPIVRRNLTAAFVLVASLSVCALFATNATSETDSFPSLQRWVFTNPLPILLLKAFGVIFVAGVMGISAHCLLVPETDKGTGEWE